MENTMVCCKEIDFAKDGVVISAEEDGVLVGVILDPARFLPIEEQEIAEMLVRVMNSYLRRRKFTMENPGLYGIVIN
jgi:hypothetical protein